MQKPVRAGLDAGAIAAADRGSATLVPTGRTACEPAQSCPVEHHTDPVGPPVAGGRGPGDRSPERGIAE